MNAHAHAAPEGDFSSYLFDSLYKDWCHFSGMRCSGTESMSWSCGGHDDHRHLDCNMSSPRDTQQRRMNIQIQHIGTNEKAQETETGITFNQLSKLCCYITFVVLASVEPANCISEEDGTRRRIRQTPRETKKGWKTRPHARNASKRYRL